MNLERALSAAGELLLGAACHGCSEPWWGICPRWRSAVRSYGCFATRPDPCPVGFPFTVSTAPYDAILRQLVAAHKERGAFNLTPFLAGRLAAAIGCVLHLTASPASRSAAPTADAGPDRQAAASGAFGTRSGGAQRRSASHQSSGRLPCHQRGTLSAPDRGRRRGDHRQQSD